MKKWLLLIVVVVILAFVVFRERYENYDEALADVNQTAGYVNPTCESGFTLSADYSTCSKEGSTETKPPSCPSGTSFVKHDNGGVCEPAAAPAETTASTPASTPPSTPPSAPATTTGGSSTSARGSTATTGSGKGVWGPSFVGFGEGGSGSSGDSTKSTQYPTMLGGFMGSKPSTMVPGVGAVSPSTPGLSLPSSASMGSDANSGYLPYSRQPGDMDLIPDPYRLSKSYSASNHSSKSEPVPFLTDFSAFMK